MSSFTEQKNINSGALNFGKMQCDFIRGPVIQYECKFLPKEIKDFEISDGREER